MRGRRLDSPAASRSRAVHEKARWTRRAFFFFLLAAAGTASAEGREPVRSLLEIRQANVIIQQWDVSCGAAALATLLTYHHGDPVSERTVAQAMLGKTDPLRVKVRRGFSLLDLKRYAEARGFQADGYAGLSLADLEELGPAIVAVKLDGYPPFLGFRARGAERVVICAPALRDAGVRGGAFQEAGP